MCARDPLRIDVRIWVLTDARNDTAQHCAQPLRSPTVFCSAAVCASDTQFCLLRGRSLSTRWITTLGVFVMEIHE